MTISAFLRHRIIYLLLAGIFLVYGASASAFSIREFLGLDDKKAEEKKEPVKAAQPANTADNTGKSADSAFNYKLDYEELQKIVSVLNTEQRKTILADQESFQDFIDNEARNKSVLAAAHANNIDQNERNLFIARRGAENVIRQIYLNQLISSRIPEDFPTEEQMRQFYENNKARFTLDERVPVWQIFLPIEENAATKDIELVKKQAETIITDIKKGKTDFGAAAREHSSQQAGRLRDGFLGIVNVTELRPDIRGPLMALEPDTLSPPITADNGVHIMKRGNTIDKQVLAFDSVKDQIRQAMNRQLRNRIRQAVFEQATEVYPSGITDKNIEEWRLKLRTQSATEETAAKNRNSSTGDVN